MEREADFMIKGYFKLDFLGSEVYITTTHVCMLIVVLALVVIGIIVNRKMKHAKAVSYTHLDVYKRQR